MSLYSLYVPSGTAGTFHDSTSPTFTSFLPQIPLYLSFDLKVNRTTGTENATLLVQINWKDSAGNALTAFSNSWGIIGSSDGVQKLTVTPPANAVSGYVYIKVTPGASNVMQHDIWIKKLRLGKTELSATNGAQAGTNLYNANGTVIQNADNSSTAPNLIFNGSFRLVNTSNVPLGWSPPAGWTWASGGNGYVVSVGGPLTAYNAALISNPFPATAGATYMVQADLASLGVTAGNLSLDVQWYTDAAGTTATASGSDGPNFAVARGVDWTPVSGSCVAPAGAVSGRLRVVLDGNAAVSSGSSAGVRRVKVAKGSVVTAFSDEATNSAQGVTVTGGVLQGIGTGSGTTVDNTLVGLGQNVIINSDFSRVGNNGYGWVAGWSGNVGNGVANWGVNLTGTPNWFGILNVAYSHHSYNGTAGQGGLWDSHNHTPAGPATPQALTDLQRWALPVYDGDRVFASCLLAHHRCTAEVHVTYYDGTGAYLSEVGGGSQGRDLGATNGDPANFDRATFFGAAPTGARYAKMCIRATTISGQADPYIFYTQMMLCKVAAGQTTAPPYAPGPISDPGAEVNRWIVGPPQSTVFHYDYLGAAQTGEFTRTMTFTLMSSSGAVTSGITWTNRIINGGYNSATSSSGSFAMTVSGGVGSLNVASMQSSSATIEVTANYNGQSYTKQFTITQDVAAAPVSSSGGGVTTIASKSSGFSTLGNATFIDASGAITGTMPTGKTTATVSVQLDVSPQGSGTGSWPIEMKLMRDVAGTPTQIGTTQTATATWDDTAMDGNDASFNFTVSDTGLTAGTSYNWRIYVRDAGATRNFFVTGTVTVTA